MSKNYFIGNNEHPQHLSVGAVVLNNKNEICIHHFLNYPLQDKVVDFYLLMRETVNPDETLEEALHRGLEEEFGIKAILIDYLGSIKSKFPSNGTMIEKTTIYFLCRYQSQDLNLRDINDVEGKTKIEWQSADFLIPKMKEQGKKSGRSDIDESDVLKRLKKLKII
ncbi:NUDIX domain-containing protein [Candidatus Pacearchaeota archaeon]|nr:NUDIX domain-containing protein [Candidatus Pacearchaeota archaeon]